MEPLTIGMFALSLGAFAYDRIKGKKGDAAPAPAGPQPMLFTPAAVEQFTRLEGGVRCFSPVPAKTVLQDLELRSVVPQAVPPHVRTLATGFRVVPLPPGGESAASVVRKAVESGAVVLGSLSLIALTSGQDASFVLLITNEDGARQLAPARDAAGLPAAWARLTPSVAAAASVPEPREAPPPAATGKRPRKPRAQKPEAAPPAPAPAPDIKPPAAPGLDMSKWDRVGPQNGAAKAAPASLMDAVASEAPREGA